MLERTRKKKTMTQDIHAAAGDALAECAYYSEGRPDDEALEFASESVVTALKAVTGQELDRNRLEDAYRSALFEREKGSCFHLTEDAEEEGLLSFLAQNGGIDRSYKGKALFTARDAGRYLVKKLALQLRDAQFEGLLHIVNGEISDLLKKTDEHAEQRKLNNIDDAFLESAKMIRECFFSDVFARVGL